MDSRLCHRDAEQGAAGALSHPAGLQTLDEINRRARQRRVKKASGRLICTSAFLPQQLYADPTRQRSRAD